MRHSTLKVLEKLDLPDSCTIGEAKQRIQNEIADKEAQRKITDVAVTSEYKGKFLKLITKEKLFGQTLVVIHINDIKPESYTSDWERTFELSGKIIEFDKLHITSREFNKGNVSSFYTEKELGKFTKITEEDYTYYLQQYITMSGTLKKLIESE